jgi:hypothetical protein
LNQKKFPKAVARSPSLGAARFDRRVHVAKREADMFARRDQSKAIRELIAMRLIVLAERGLKVRTNWPRP